MNYYSEKIFLHVLFKNIPIGKPDSLGFCNHVCQDSEQKRKSTLSAEVP